MGDGGDGEDDHGRCGMRAETGGEDGAEVCRCAERCQQRKDIETETAESEVAVMKAWTSGTS
jgi:hypothetical protein